MKLSALLFGLLVSASAFAQTVAPPAGSVQLPQLPAASPANGTDPVTGAPSASPLQGTGSNIMTMDPSVPIVAGDAVVVGPDGQTPVDGGAPPNSSAVAAIEPPLTIADFGDTDAASGQYYWSSGTPAAFHIQASTRSVAHWAAAFLGYQLTVVNAPDNAANTNGIVGSYYVEVGGAGFGAVPTLSVPDCPGAVPTATLTSGVITGISYGTANTTACMNANGQMDGLHAVTVTGGSPTTPAVIWASVPDGVAGTPQNGITNYYVQVGGQNYSNSVTATNTSCPSAVPGAVTIANGAVTSVGIGNPGSGGCSPLTGTLTLTDAAGTGSGAVVQYTTSAGGDYGGYGETSAGILARISDVTGDRPGIVVIRCCSADVRAGFTLDQSVTNLTAMVTALAANNQIAVLVGDSPQAVCATPNTTVNSSSACGDALTTAQQLQLAALDEFKRRYTLTQQTTYAATNNNVLFVNCAQELTEPTAGGPIVGVKYDNEHMSNGGAAACGWKLAKLLSSRIGLPLGLDGFYGSQSVADTYDPVNNFTGILNPSSTMSGTGGSLGSSGCTGTLATGWTVARSSTGTAATINCTLTEGTRSDGYAGTSQKVVLATTATGAGDVDRYTFTLNGSAASWGIAPGDVIQPQALFEVSGTTKLSMLSLRFQCVGSSSPYPQQLYNEWGGNSGDWYMDSPAMGSLTTAKPFIAKGLPSQVPADCTQNVNLNVLVAIDASQTGAGATVEFTGVQVRKVVGSAVQVIAAGGGTVGTGTTSGSGGGASAGAGSAGQACPANNTTAAAPFLPYTGVGGGGGPAIGAGWVLRMCDNFAGTSIDYTKWSGLFNGKPSTGGACVWNTFQMNPSSAQGSPGTSVAITSLHLAPSYNLANGYSVTDSLGYIPPNTTITVGSRASSPTTITLSHASTTALPTSDVLTFYGGSPSPATNPLITEGGGYATMTAISVPAGQVCGYSGEYDYDTGYKYAQALLNSRKSYTPLYGYYEAAFQFGSTASDDGRDDGLISYLLNEDGITEIDGVEVLSKSPTNAHFTYHWSGKQSANEACPTCAANTTEPGGSGGEKLTWATGQNFNTGFHVFGVDWEPTFIKWYLDGVLVKTYTDTTSGSANTIAHAEMEILLLPNTCKGSGSGWCNAPTVTANTYPSTMKVKDFRAYQHPGQTYN